MLLPEASRERGGARAIAFTFTINSARARASSFRAGQNACKANGALALILHVCGSRWACRPAGRRTAREGPRAGAFGGARAAGVLAAVLVLGPAKCYAGLFGHHVQSVCSQGVCAGRGWFRIRQEGCGQAICAGGIAIRGVGGYLSVSVRLAAVLCSDTGGPILEGIYLI